MTRTFSTRLFKVEPEEAGAVIWSFLYFFCLLAGYYMLRPLREAMAAECGERSLKWLFLGTAGAMLVASLIFAALTTRFSRRRFIPWAYRFFSANLLIFFILRKVLPESEHVLLGRVYFVWVSVFILFVVSVFWSFMADTFTSPQGKRLFALIAVGGTLGQIYGSFLAKNYPVVMDSANLLLVTIVLLEVACWCVYRLNAVTAGGPEPGSPPRDKPLGGSALDGLKRVARSPYLLGICLFLLCYTVTSAFLYGTKIDLIGRLFPDESTRVTMFANIDFWSGIAIILAQIFLTSRIIARFGVGVTLGVLPVVTLIGFVVLGTSLARPESLATLGILIVFEAVRRASNFAMSRPAREVLYTVVPRQDKYKSKNVIDTFVYRGGDVVGIWTFDGLLAVGLSAAAVCFATVPIAAGWLVVALALGRRQTRLAEEKTHGQL